MLRSFIADQVTVADIEAWGEAIEVRDDIGFEAEHEELLKTIIFGLSTGPRRASHPETRGTTHQ
jgi:hypothetical protein